MLRRKRRYCSTCILIFAAVAVLFLLVPSAQAEDWPMFRHDLSHTGYTNESVQPPLELKWKYKTGGAVVSSPAVSENVVYVGSQDSHVYALNASIGSLKWKYKTDGPVGSSPAVSNGVVYVGSYDKNVYALDANTGTLKWKYQATTMNGIIHSSPAVANGIVYLGESGRNNAEIHALDANTGTLKWKYQTYIIKISQGGAIQSSPAVVNGIVYVRSNDNFIHALDANTGTLKWKNQTICCSGLSSPAVVNGIVYVGSYLNDGNIYAIDSNTGALKWKYQTGGNDRSSPAVANGIMYVGSDDKNVYALDANTGALKWKYNTTNRSDVGGVSSSPAVAKDIVYVGSSVGFNAIDAQTGVLKWKYDATSVTSSPAIANGMVYVGGGYDIYAFAPKNQSTVAAIIQPTTTTTSTKTTTPPGTSLSGVFLFIILAVLAVGAVLLLKSRRIPTRHEESKPDTGYIISNEVKMEKPEAPDIIKLASKFDFVKRQIMEAKQMGIAVHSVEELLAKAQHAFEEKDYPSAEEYYNQCADRIERLLKESKPVLSLRIPEKGYQCNVWNSQEIEIANEGTSSAKEIRISFSQTFEVKGLDIIPRIYRGEHKLLKANIKPKQSGSIPLNISLHYKDMQNREYKSDKTFKLYVEPEARVIYRPEILQLNKLLQRYTILVEVGEGGMGVVFKARDTLLDSIVAIKIMSRALADSEDAIKRFQREAKAQASLRGNPNVVNIFDVGEENNIYYIVMEYADGGSLKDVLKNGYLSINKAKDVLLQVCNGLEAAHNQGIIHRDIKPGNILLTKEGIAKLSDFGLAKIGESSTSGALMGSLPYISPEQIRGEKVDEKSDIYSLGATFYEMLTCRTPFYADNAAALIHKHLSEKPPSPRVYNPSIPAKLEKLILKALAKEPTERFQSVGELMVYLRT